jgi:hypothetical protein
VYKFLFLNVLTFFVASAQSLIVVNPNFENVPIQCAAGYAIQAYNGGNCFSPSPEQAFNVAPGIGWKFTPTEPGTASPATGLTVANTAFNPPPFTGLPFSTAALLQKRNSVILQTIHGFVPGVVYGISFYLGSRYAEGSFDGNQTVQVAIDGKVIGTISLVSFTPFTFHTLYFGVASGGPHVLTFEGLVAGDHTAFFSGVSIRAVADQVK